MRTLLPVLVLALASGGCRPPDAPTELDELCSYIFEHQPDRQPWAMRAGTENLHAWLGDNLEQTFDGYTISNLAQETVDELDDVDRDLEGLLGAAVGYELGYELDDVVHAIVAADQLAVFPDQYEVYDRTFLDDVGCFLEMDCTHLEVTNEIVMMLPFGIEVVTDNRTQFRWVDTDVGTVMTQRAWLEGPADVSVDFLTVDQQYWIAVALPWDDGHTLRLEAIWMVAELMDAPLPEDAALNLVIDTLKDNGEDIEAYLD